MTEQKLRSLLKELISAQDYVTHYNERGPEYTASELAQMKVWQTERKRIMEKIVNVFKETQATHSR